MPDLSARMNWSVSGRTIGIEHRAKDGQHHREPMPRPRRIVVGPQQLRQLVAGDHASPPGHEDPQQIPRLARLPGRRRYGLVAHPYLEPAEDLDLHLAVRAHAEGQRHRRGVSRDAAGQLTLPGEHGRQPVVGAGTRQVAQARQQPVGVDRRARVAPDRVGLGQRRPHRRRIRIDRRPQFERLGQPTRLPAVPSVRRGHVRQRQRRRAVTLGVRDPSLRDQRADPERALRVCAGLVDESGGGGGIVAHEHPGQPDQRRHQRLDLATDPSDARGLLVRRSGLLAPPAATVDVAETRERGRGTT